MITHYFLCFIVGAIVFIGGIAGLVKIDDWAAPLPEWLAKIVAGILICVFIVLAVIGMTLLGCQIMEALRI